MSIESVRKEFEEKRFAYKIIEFEASTATVELAAEALGVEPGRIAKTMAFDLKGEDVLVLMKGDTRIDNKKFKAVFGKKAKMVPSEVIEERTGHPMGGVCPFGNVKGLRVFMDESLKVYDVVYPAAGSRHSAVEISVKELAAYTGNKWISIGKE
ncbi:MAG: YbaK/EbsC family protein [Peptostreptococcaceae bacterium]|nr:YbaK/EbsC family protein [Peptostreptococcaceae bacterium]